MRRFGAFWLPALWLMVLMASCVGAEDPGDPFVSAWNRWAKVANSRVQVAQSNQLVDAGEFMKWQETKREWRKLEKLVDGYYRGDKR